MEATDQTPQELARQMDLPKTASPAAILLFNTFREEIFEALVKRGWLKMVKPEQPPKKGGGHGDPTL
ncbi:MAG: hypothetical protein ABIK08_11365 [Pseudomonadota bacterium]